MANECTPYWHRVCPKCGSCSCKEPGGTIDPMCNLHGYRSMHDMPQVTPLPPGTHIPRRRRSKDADGPDRGIQYHPET